MENETGLKTEPCGTPQSRVKVAEYLLPIRVKSTECRALEGHPIILAFYYDTSLPI